MGYLDHMLGEKVIISRIENNAIWFEGQVIDENAGSIRILDEMYGVMRVPKKGIKIEWENGKLEVYDDAVR